MGMVVFRIKNQKEKMKRVLLIQCVRKSKTLLVIPSILISIFWSLSPAPAKDFGIQGVVFPIEEEDPIVTIKNKLKVMEKSGELERQNRELQKKTTASVERPKPVEGLTRTTQTRVFYYDPTYVVKTDITDPQGQIFAKKGTKINPLETVILSHSLLFFDGDDAEQKAWVLQKRKEGSFKLILIKGAPLSLSEELKVPVYFDQSGVLTQKFGIQHIPALVTQQDFRLRIEEIPLLSQEKEAKGGKK